MSDGPSRQHGFHRDEPVEAPASASPQAPLDAPPVPSSAPPVEARAGAGRLLLVATCVAAVVAVAGPVLLWLNVSVGRGEPLAARMGFLVVLIGLGLVVLALPWLLADSIRPSGGRRGWTPGLSAATVALLVLGVGAYLLASPTPSDDGDAGQDRPRQSQPERGGGRDR